ncbi:MAG: hypothetical protein BGO09_04775 [Bacteroidetes bacterium 47-18]|nr:MAG: hypothetical protein BGO09_04775 [Bacteroidetes bacterium 47-18]
MKPMLTIKQYYVKPVARILFVIMWLELLAPVQQAMALTSGPTTPEMGGFEPVGTTDMVNTFSGDFVYNLPLFDLEGYPVNLAYHSGSGMEDEASWVGLGWSLNPGQINRGVRGIPDDYDGEQIIKRLHVEPEREYVFNAGINVGFELAGAVRVGFGIDADVTFNNYRGCGLGFNATTNIKIPLAGDLGNQLGVGMNMGVNSLSGADIGTSVSLYLESQSAAPESMGGSISAGTGFNSRYGLKDPNFGLSVYKRTTQEVTQKNAKLADGSRGDKVHKVRRYSGFSTGGTIPIGLQNFTPSISNPMKQVGFGFRLQVGSEVLYGYPHLNVGMTYSISQFERDGTRNAFGYLNLQNARYDDILDFTRDKDGSYNKTHKSLPTSALSYDVYSVNGQGTGGMFRPFRNDMGTIYDPKLYTLSGNDNKSLEVGGPIGLSGGLLEVGVNNATMAVLNKSGVGSKGNLKEHVFRFRSGEVNRVYENVYFKNAGEYTYNYLQDEAAISSKSPVLFNLQQVSTDNGKSYQSASGILQPREQRSARATHYSYLTNFDAGSVLVGAMPELLSYPVNTGRALINRRPERIKRNIFNTYDEIKRAHIGEFRQTLPDGRRYIYAIPAKNSIQREATFSVNPANADVSRGVVTFNAQEDSENNPHPNEKYFQSTIMPAHAYAYLLTASLSADYVDVTGDGPTEDDLGTYTKFNYSRAVKDYRWIAPYSANATVASYHPGNWTDKKDDKGSYIIGAKDVWYINSIESKNQIAEFYISERKDGLGTMAPVIKPGELQGTGNVLLNNTLTSPLTTRQKSYQLDSIVIYNKSTRFDLTRGPVPLKTIIFQYSNELCPGLPNSEGGVGKLTLKKVYTRNGTSGISLLNPYEFQYAQNADYDLAAKDRWGTYKPAASNGGGLTNYEFPYSPQQKSQADDYAAKWQLSRVIMPSGAVLDIAYESNDYSYVQDKRAMEMMRIAGLGNSPNFYPVDMLYNDPVQTNDYVYLKRDKTREAAGLSIRDNYLDGQDMLYFNFKIDIGNRGAYEPVRGYAKVEAVAVCPDNDDYFYIKLRKEKAGETNNNMISAIALAGLNFAKVSAPYLIYPGLDPDSDRQIAEGLAAAFDEFGNMGKNVNMYLLGRHLSKLVNTKQSWVRVQAPGFTKYGGGVRVRSITLSDEWDQMTGSFKSTYGKQYEYTITSDRTGGKISSGVAVNEPSIGADESPLRQPEPYTAQSGRLLPPVKLFKETPHAESFLPTATVGYSRVVVHSLHVNDAKSSKYENVYEYYTARDFPVRIEQTPVATYKERKRANFFLSEVEASVGQGYAVILNDMHGKPKFTADYVLKTTGNNAALAEREEISSTRYVYQTDANGNLDNNVRALMPPSPSSSGYSIADVTLGEDVDINHDVRYNYSFTTSHNISFNLNTVNFGWFVFPLPTMFSPNQSKENEFTSQVTTKFVQQYGILKEVITQSHGAKVVQENLLYDAQSGNPIHSVVNNQYNDRINTLSIPAYLAYNYMQPSYLNEGLRFEAESLVFKGDLIYFIPKCDEKLIRVGDQVLVKIALDNYNFVMKHFWVVGKEFVNVDKTDDPGVLTSYTPGVGGSVPNPGDQICVFRVQPRVLYGESATLPNTNKNPDLQQDITYEDVPMTIVVSGNRNMLNANVQELSFMGDRKFVSLSDMLNVGVTDKILNTTASLFDNMANVSLHGSREGSPPVYNDFVSGRKGNIYQQASYVYNTERMYNDHSRNDGYYKDYYPFWKTHSGSVGACAEPAPALDRHHVSTYKWMVTSQLMRVSYGNIPLETWDASGIISSARYGFNQTLPMVMANNAGYSEVRYYSFEDERLVRNRNMHLQGWPTTSLLGILDPQQTGRNRNVAFTNIIYNNEYFKYDNQHYYTGFNFVTENAHTGLHALIATQNAQDFHIIPVSDLNNKRYKISYWLKNLDGSKPVVGPVVIKSYQGSSLMSTLHPVLSIVSGPIDGWYKVEGTIDYPFPAGSGIPSGYIPHGIYLRVAQVNQLVDDIRFAPVNAAVVSYAYNNLTYRLMAQLDNNNFATFYEYDAEGNMVRTKKETDRGIMTINEGRKSYKK